MRILLFCLVAVLTMLSTATSRADSCVRMEEGGGLGAWVVINQCGYKAIGSFCYEDDSPMSCRSGGGGFGPLDSGDTETVSPPDMSPVRWRATWCDYDDWVSGDCVLQDLG